MLNSSSPCNGLQVVCSAFARQFFLVRSFVRKTRLIIPTPPSLQSIRIDAHMSHALLFFQLPLGRRQQHYHHVTESRVALAIKKRQALL